MTRSEKKKELPPSRREAGSNTRLRSAGSDERYAVRLEWRSEAGSALHACGCACEVASGAGGASALGAVHGKGLMRGGKEVTLGAQVQCGGGRARQVEYRIDHLWSGGRGWKMEGATHIAWGGEAGRGVGAIELQSRAGARRK